MAITANQKVLTLDYWKPASKLEVGDIVFNQQGNPVRVTLVQQYPAKSCYRVTFNDHLTVEGDDRLLFQTESKKYRHRSITYKGRHKFRRPLAPMTVEQVQQHHEQMDKPEKKLSIPTAHPINLPHQDLPVPPFVFGYWFMNRKRAGHLTVFAEYSDYVLDRMRDNGYIPKTGINYTPNSQHLTITPSIELQLAPFVPVKIPNNYLLASVEQRLELMRGILTSKLRQYNKKTDNFRITNKNYAIIRQIQQLAESLGCKTRLHYDETKHYYTCNFKSRYDLIPNQQSPKFKIHPGRRYFAKIEPIQPQLCVYVETDGESNPILVGEGFISCR